MQSCGFKRGQRPLLLNWSDSRQLVGDSICVFRKESGPQNMELFLGDDRIMNCIVNLRAAKATDFNYRDIQTGFLVLTSFSRNSHCPSPWARGRRSDGFHQGIGGDVRFVRGQ
jgi:hypothetical protein